MKTQRGGAKEEGKYWNIERLSLSKLVTGSFSLSPEL